MKSVTESVAELWGKLKLNSLLVGGQVIVHHDHDLLVRDAVLVDDLVGMAHIGLGNGRKGRGHKLRLLLGGSPGGEPREWPSRQRCQVAERR